MALITLTDAQNPQDNSTYATGKPLPTKTNEGFWGHLNPLARVARLNARMHEVSGSDKAPRRSGISSGSW